MVDPMAQDMGAGSAVISDAFVAARELLKSAEDDAARLRADVDRYVRQREQEAELLVAKARRLLAMAEERAASLASGAAAQVVDLDAPLTVPSPRSAPDVPARSEPTGLDGILASAINKALDRSFPSLR